MTSSLVWIRDNWICLGVIYRNSKYNISFLLQPTTLLKSYWITLARKMWLLIFICGFLAIKHKLVVWRLCNVKTWELWNPYCCLDLNYKFILCAAFVWKFWLIIRHDFSKSIWTGIVLSNINQSMISFTTATSQTGANPVVRIESCVRKFSQVFNFLSHIIGLRKQNHYNDVIMGAIASQITSLAVVYSTVYSGWDQRKHQSSASLAFVRGIHRDRWIPRTNGQ